MKIAVTGTKGQVTLALQNLGFPDTKVVTLGRPAVDLRFPKSIKTSIQGIDPDVIVSAAAYTAVDKAEAEREDAFAINKDGAKALAETALELDIPIIHLSTDYVYDGMKTHPYNEMDPTDPISVYGQSKLEGERAVAEVTANHVILRTAWVYSVYGNNFIKNMLRLAQSSDRLSIVADQFGSPTSADDIALAVTRIARRVAEDRSSNLRGVFNLAGLGETSWADFAVFIFSILEEETGKTVSVVKIASSEYPTAANRPLNSRLDCAKISEQYGIQMPFWQESARLVVKRLLKKESI